MFLATVVLVYGSKLDSGSGLAHGVLVLGGLNLAGTAGLLGRNLRRLAI